jgi:CelD/BcsL family acetyltransferase involved in cellulose biosynthesis
MGVRVRLHEEAEALWALGSQWEALWHDSMTRVPFLKPAWAQIWWRHFGDGFRLRLLSAWEDDRLVGVAPLCQKAHDPAPLQWIGGEELCDFQDFVIRRGKERSVLSALWAELERLVDPAHGVDLHSVSADSPTLAEVDKILYDDWDLELVLEDVAPWVALSCRWEEFLGGLTGKDRHELRRKLRKAQAAWQPVFRVLHDERGWEEGIAAFLRLHRISQPQKALFMTAERGAFFREVGRAFLREGGIRLALLEISGEPVAATISFVYGDTWGLYNSGYDPQYSAYSPGIVLVSLTIQRAMEEGLRVYDFLRGGEGYKYRFGARDRDLFHLRILPRGRPS